MEIPSPIVQGYRGFGSLGNSITDKIVDGAGDASVGTCGGANGRDGSNGYDSHTYIDCNAKGRLAVDWATQKGTEDGDSIIRNPPALWDETLICNHFIGARIYSVTQLTDHNLQLFNSEPAVTLPYIRNLFIRGEFYIPPAPVLAGTFTKTFQFRSGADRGTSDISLWDRVLDGDFEPKLDRRAEFAGHEFAALNYWNLKCLNYLRGGLFFLAWDRDYGNPLEIEIENGDNITTEDYTLRSLNDRRVILKATSKNELNNDVTKNYDTGLTLGDYIDGGILVQIEVEQTAVEPVLEGVTYKITSNITHRIPQSGFSVTGETVEPLVGRCDNGSVRLYAFPSQKTQSHWPIDGVFKPNGSGQIGTVANTGGWRVANHDPAWWVNEINRRAEDFPEPNEDKQHMMLFPWINHFEITNGNFSDTANFIVVRFLHKDSSGAIKQAVYATDYAGVTIPDGTEINIGEVIAGDTFELGLDNLGEATTEVTAITFDTPFISTVDDSTPTLLPYDFTTVSFTTSAADTGSSDIVITHDKNNLLIPSPWTLTLTTQSGPIDGGGAGI
jgi:hypothetical protein